MKRGQQSMEFILIFAFSMIVFIILAGVAASSFSNQETNRLANQAENVARTFSLTLDLLSSGPADATYDFAFPPYINGRPYTVEIRESSTLIIVEGVRVLRPGPRIDMIAGDLASSEAGESYARFDVGPDSPCTSVTITKSTSLEVAVNEC